MVVTPYMPVPDTNGEEWDRLEPSSALDALVELVLHGEYNSIIDGERRTKDGMELRAAALGIFQVLSAPLSLSHLLTLNVTELCAEGGDLGGNCPRNGNETRSVYIPNRFEPLLTMKSGSQTPVTPLLYALTTVPISPLNLPSVTSTHFATLLFAHLLRLSPRAKTTARSIIPQGSSQSATGGSFFVPADGSAPPPPPEDAGDVDEPQTLLQILSEHLSLALLTRARPDVPDREAREWDRLCVGYLCLLAQWLWEDPAAVREFLEAGALGVVSGLGVSYQCGLSDDSYGYSWWSRSTRQAKRTH